MEHFCEIILESGHRPLDEMSFKRLFYFSFGGHFVQRSKTVLAILIEGHPRNISVKLF